MEQKEDGTEEHFKKKFQQDKIQILKILPEEIWLQVFERIADPKDKERLSNSSLFFRKLVRSQKTQFLFQSVWEVLGKKYEKNITVPGSVYRESEPPEHLFSALSISVNDNGEDEKEIETNHTAKLLVTLIKRLRSVCKSWDRAVTYYFGNHYMHYEQQSHWSEEAKIEKIIEPLVRQQFLGSDPGKVDKFLEYFRETHESGNQSPFFGNDIFVVLPHGESQRDLEFVNKMISVLTKYGRHVWSCTISVEQLCPNGLIRSYSRVTQMLELMPNLKVFRLSLRLHWFCRTLVDPIIREQLLAAFRARPLPPLKDLQVLSTCSVSTPIFHELIRNYSHFSTLNIIRLHDDDYDFYTVPLPNFKKLTIFYNTEADFVKLMSPRVNWRLTKLSLGVDTIQFIKWQRIFSFVQEKWADTLTELDLELPKAKELEDKRRIYQEGAAIQLNLPHLKVLKLAMYNLCAFDFLLSLKDSLEHLELVTIVTAEENEFEDAKDLEKASCIKLLSCVERPLETNIWTHFPKLKRIGVEYYVHKEGPSKFSSRHEKWLQTREQWRNRIMHTGSEIRQSPPFQFFEPALKRRLMPYEFPLE